MARAIPRLRLVVAAGPRAPVEERQQGGLEVRRYLPRLYEHLACSDAAFIQGGLSTGMELIALRRPFVSFPLHNHFEQRFHVARRFRRYGHMAQMDYKEITPDGLVEAVRRQLGASLEYRPVAPGGAQRAAEVVSRVLG